MARIRETRDTKPTVVAQAGKQLAPADVRAVGEVIDAIAQWFAGFEAGRATVGELILRNVFDEDARAMLAADRAQNPRLRELLRRAETELKLSDRTLSVMCRITAFDHLVQGRSWKRLETPVKEALLPLAAQDAPGSLASLRALNSAAKHAIDFDLDRETARRYVQEQLRQQGKATQRRGGAKTYERQLDRSLDLFGTEDGAGQLVAVAEKLDDEARTQLEHKLRAAAQAMLAAAKRLRSR